MKTANLIKALEKVGLKVSIRPSHMRNICTCQGEKYELSFHDENGEASCCYIKLIGQEDDLRTDYFPGFFRHKIKDIVRWLQETK